MLKAFLLAGASMLAVAATSAEAGTTFNTPGDYTWTAPSAGIYEIEVWGAQGGASMNSYINATYAGGRGAGVWAEGYLAAGRQLRVMVGQQGGAGFNYGGGGGGASAVLDPSFLPNFSFLTVAGGGGGAGEYGAGGDGQAPTLLGSGGNGLGTSGYGKGGLLGTPGWYGDYGAPGGGVESAYGHVHIGGGYVDGGAGGAGAPTGGYYGGGPAGGSGFAGGGGAWLGGGGGGGYSGGGGGGFDSDAILRRLPMGGGGGGSVARGGISSGSLAYRTGDGLVEILSLSAVPEPSEWMLMLLGLAFTGHMLRRERWRRARGLAAAR